MTTETEARAMVMYMEQLLEDLSTSDSRMPGDHRQIYIGLLRELRRAKIRFSREVPRVSCPEGFPPLSGGDVPLGASPVPQAASVAAPPRAETASQSLPPVPPAGLSS